MASNTEFDDLLARVPLADLAGRFGVDQTTMETAVRQALPGLVGGMAVNASEDRGAAELAQALQRHTGAEARPKLKAIDTDDGRKIVNHVLGDRTDSVAQALGSQSGDSAIAGLIPQLLPVLAPLVMQFLAGRVGGSASDGGAGGLGGVLGDLLGGMFGGGSSAGSQSQASGGLDDLLGGLLGGGSGGSGGSGRGSSSGGLDDLLGGLLGGR